MKRFFKVLLGLLAMLLLAGAVLWGLMDDERGNRWAVSVIRDRFAHVVQLPPGELEAWLTDPARQPKPVLLDARSEEEYTLSHLQDAVPLDVETVTPEQIRVLDRSRDYVVYCSAGYRSCQLAEKLKAEGFLSVQNLEGGLFSWANAARPVYQGQEKARAVHPYHPLFSRLLKPQYRP